MKKSINRLGILFAFFAIMLAFAFTPANRVDQVYYFTGNSSEDIKMTGEWSQSTIPTDCQTVEILPCALTLPDNVSLSTFLSEHSEEEITSASEGRRPE